jgi:uncharacterized membrane protein SpoIIM required for sporulation
MRARTMTTRASIDLRKLAAIDMAFLGSNFVFTEYVTGVLLSMTLGLFVLLRGHSFRQTVLGLYLVSLGINYVPMLIYAAGIGSKQAARAQVADELTEERRAFSKYRAQSLLLLVPLLAPILALSQRRSGSAKVE